MNKHPIFPVELYTFENTDLIEPTLDALDPIERGMFNMPNNVQTTAAVSYTHLTLPTNTPV